MRSRLLPITDSVTGFTLVEILIAVAIISILSSVGLASYQQIIKKTREVEVNTQLSAASKKLLESTLTKKRLITQASCLSEASLNDSPDFVYSCTQRDDGSNAFDIHMKPRRDYGVGGLLSFAIGSETICWESCDATGSGSGALLSKTSLGLETGCPSLIRQEQIVDCNCSEPVWKIVDSEPIINCTTWITCRVTGSRPIWGWETSCEKCTEVTYSPE